MRIYIGIDNGVTGSVGVVGENIEPVYFPVPAFKQQSYTKKKQNITRIDTHELRHMIRQALPDVVNDYDVFAVIERPMINPGRFQASISAARALEAVLTVIEFMDYGHCYIDSKEWQRELLPAGCKQAELKQISSDIGKRLFPLLSDAIDEHKDADGILIAEYARRKGL